MPAAIPLVAAGISAYGSYRSAKNASKPNPGEQSALDQQTGIAGDVRKQSQSLFGMGQPALQQSSQYYSKLAGGNHAAMGQALAPDIAQVNDVYGGSRRTLSRFLRGPDKDYQLGELERERGGKIASLFTTGRQNAVARLLDFGQNATGAGLAGQGQAAGIFGNVGRQEQTNRFAGAQFQQQAGGDFGNLLFELLKSYGQKGKGRSSSSSFFGPGFNSGVGGPVTGGT